MKIVILAAEGAPYCKSGGLGDVMEGLPAALSRIEENEVLLFLPYYPQIMAYETEPVANFQVDLGWRRQYAGILRHTGRADGVQVYFVDNRYYFGDRTGALYGHPDDGERFTFFSKACLIALGVMGFTPHILHCNDWQTAPAAIFLKAQFSHCFPHTRCVFTIHNIEYQGWANADFFDDVLALPEDYRKRLDMHGAVNLMKGAIELSDFVTTVSQTYARELTDAYYAHGLQDVIARATEKLTGITNGIHADLFDPQTDPALPAHYGPENPEPKAICKAALQKEMGLPVNARTPLLVMVTRLVSHKGLDLLRHIAQQLMEQDCQLIVLGTGEGQYEDFFRWLAEAYPQKAAARITFDLPLASRIYAGGDIYLMPSKSEPCGLSQMNAMRYGTVPVVHAVGGLRDTVPPCDNQGQGGLGFTFQSYNPDDFYHAIQNATNLYINDPDRFQTLRQKNMSQDFSWDKPARSYMQLFQKERG